MANWRRVTGVIVMALSSFGVGSCSSPEVGPTSERRTSALLSSSSGLALEVLTNSCGANQEQNFFEVLNNTAAGVKLSDITIKYWVNDTSGQAVVPHVWTGGCLNNASGCFHQVSGVTASAASFGPACGSDPNHQANWEITISNADSTVLGPGVSWTNIQAALNLANFSNFSPGTATWFSPCLTGTNYAPDSHFAIYTQGNLVFSSGIPTPACRSPQGQQQLQGQITPEMATAPLVGPVPPATIVHLSIQLPTPAPQMQALLAAADAVSDPNSSTYQQYLTVPQIAALYGPAQSDYSSLTAFAQSKGLTVTGSFSSRLALGVSGPASTIEQAFYVNLNNYLRPDGTQFYGPDREPSVDLATTLGHISGLDSFRVAVPLAGSGLSGSFFGKDFRTAYASCSSMTGSGQVVGLFSEEGFDIANVQDYEDAEGIPHVPVNFVSVDNAPNDTSNGNEEISMDIEAAVSMAPGLSQIVVFGGANPNASPENILLTMLDSKTTINQFSASWIFYLSNEDMIPWFTLAGKSFFVGSGDTGSFSPFLEGDTDGRALPYITVVGGTSLTMNGNGSSYGSETVWNEVKEAVAGSTIYGASGGGYTNLPTPPYQAAVNTNKFRSIPDLSIVAAGARSDVGVEVEFTSSDTGAKTKHTELRGTSVSSPLMAGYMALINQQRAQNGLPPGGFINPAIYDIGQTPSVYATNFNDIADGSTNAFPFLVNAAGNLVPTTAGPAFKAVAGYDLASGWGTPKCNLISQLAGPSPTGPLAVTAGKMHACAVRPGGGVECWGDNSAGQLGNGTNNVSAKGVNVSGLSGVTQIAAGAMHTCALLTSGTVSCWGFNGDGELGNGSTGNSNVPVPVSGLSQVITLAAGGQHTCAILSDLTVRCWGLNSSSQLGVSSSQQPTGLVTPSISKVGALALGSDFSCALVTAGTVSCWGGDEFGQLGDGSVTTTSSPNPVQVKNLTGIGSIAAGATHACATDLSAGNLLCWGDNTFGQLGDGMSASNEPNRPTPAPVVDAVQISLEDPNAFLLDPLTGMGTVTSGPSAEHACAFETVFESFWCWGDNQLGELNNDATSAQDAELVAQATTVPPFPLSFALGFQFTCELMPTGAVQCLGADQDGQLGNRTSSADQLQPVTVAF